MSYHVGLVADGDKAILEVADSVDQLSCECLIYFGERETTLKDLRAGARAADPAIFNIGRHTFRRVAVRRVGAVDFRAGN